MGEFVPVASCVVVVSSCGCNNIVVGTSSVEGGRIGGGACLWCDCQLSSRAMAMAIHSYGYGHGYDNGHGYGYCDGSPW